MAEKLADDLAEANGGPGEEGTEAERDTGTKKELTNWENVVDLVRAALWEGRLAEEATWQVVVLIPKGRGDYHGIGLVEVVRKVVSVILNLWITASITYHDFLHSFRADRSTGTTPLEAKLIQQLATMREEVLYVIFLDLHKEYDALDRGRCLKIL